MKSGIHPEFVKTTVTCSGCGTTFESMSTVPEINVEICSQCHPFYTGKQKLVDTAGRVDRFRARATAAEQKRAQIAERNAQKAIRRAEAEKSAEPLDEAMAQVEAKAETHTRSTQNDVASTPDSDSGEITPDVANQTTDQAVDAADAKASDSTATTSQDQ